MDRGPIASGGVRGVVRPWSADQREIFMKTVGIWKLGCAGRM